MKTKRTPNMDLVANEFLEKTSELPILDVRSPAEFGKGHIPGSTSFPLFQDSERHDVGICYKNKGREQAIQLGLEIVGPKLADFVSRARDIAPDGSVGMYCWRGGMRSGSMAWLLRTSGFRVYLLKGGYKNYRNHVLDTLREPRKYLVLGGLTGSGKTEVLHELAVQGEQVIDLEGIAKHKGSAFGNLDNIPQPRTEQFENILVDQLRDMDPEKPIWIEDESRSIGQVFLDTTFFGILRTSPLVVLNRTLEDRIQHLVDLYGKVSIEELMDAFRRIEKRLGGQHVKAAIEALERGDLEEASRIALVYYDKAYTFGLTKRNSVPSLDVNGSGIPFSDVAKKLKDHSQQWIKEKNPFA